MLRGHGSAAAVVVMLLAGIGADPPAAGTGTDWLRITEVRDVGGPNLGTKIRVVSVARDGAHRVIASRKWPGWIAVSPDGRYRAWYGYTQTTTRVHVAPLRGGKVRTIAEHKCQPPPIGCFKLDSLSWSRANVLAFLTHAADGTSRLGFSRADGSVLRRESFPGWSYSFRPGSPSWSPDGRTLILEKVEPDASEVILVDTKTWRSRRILRLPFRTRGAAAAWSPDGKALAITTRPAEDSHAPGTIAYALVDATSGNALVRRPACDTGPACPNGRGRPVWSPDGRQIAYTTSVGLARSRKDLSGATSSASHLTPFFVPGSGRPMVSLSRARTPSPW